MLGKHNTRPAGQFSLWDELKAPADSLAGAPVLAERKVRPAPTRPVEVPKPVREWTVSEALKHLGETPGDRATELPEGLELRWPLADGVPCPKCGAGPAGRRRYQHRGLAIVQCVPCGNSGDTLFPAASGLLAALDAVLGDAAEVC